jgi:hypothetical protein
MALLQRDLPGLFWVHSGFVAAQVHGRDSGLPGLKSLLWGPGSDPSRLLAALPVAKPFGPSLFDPCDRAIMEQIRWKVGSYQTRRTPGMNPWAIGSRSPLRGSSEGRLYRTSEEKGIYFSPIGFVIP